MIRLTLILVLMLSGCSNVEIIEPALPLERFTIPAGNRLGTLAIDFPVTETKIKNADVSSATMFGMDYHPYYSGSYTGSATSSRYELEHVPSNALNETVKHLLEEYRPAREYTFDGEGTVRIEGRLPSVAPSSANAWVTIFYDVPMFLPLVTLYFAPTWGWYEGTFELRVYAGDGEFLCKYVGRGTSKLVATGLLYWDATGEAHAAAQAGAICDGFRQFLEDLRDGKIAQLLREEHN